MNMWLKSQGTLFIKDNAVRIIVSMDFVNYYKSLIDKEFTMFTNPPAHGAHITLWNPKIHGVLNEKKAKFLIDSFKRRPIVFEYDPDIRVGGQNKDFRNFFIKVKGLDIDAICMFLGIDQHKHAHITISNTKGGVRPYIFFKKP